MKLLNTLRNIPIAGTCLYLFFAGAAKPQQPVSAPLADHTLLITYQVDFKFRKDRDYRKKESVKLFIGPEGSLFIDRKFLLFKEAQKKNLPPEEKAKALLSIGFSYFKFYLVKNYLENSTFFVEEHLNGQYNAYRQNSMSAENWTLISDADSTIRGLKVYKAECQFGGRKWMAWFTPEIPVSDGPYKFSGLPGLILKLDSSEGDYSFHISGIERDLPIEAFPPVPDHQVISETRFKEIQQIIADNPFAQLQSKGGRVEGDINLNGKVMSQEEFILHFRNDNKNNIQLEND